MQKSNNHIEEYILKSDNNSQAIASKELFKDDKIELKTDINDMEIVHINKMLFNNEILKKCGLKPAFEKFITGYMKLKVSKDRKSRGEFVTINKQNNADEVMAGMSNISNILGVRK